MPSTILDAPPDPATLPARPAASPSHPTAPGPYAISASPADRIDRLGPSGRYHAYQHRLLSRGELFRWAAHYPDEIPTVNGELPWIALTLADLD